MAQNKMTSIMIETLFKRNSDNNQAFQNGLRMVILPKYKTQQITQSDQIQPRHSLSKYFAKIIHKTTAILQYFPFCCFRHSSDFRALMASLGAKSWVNFSKGNTAKI